MKIAIALLATLSVPVIAQAPTYELRLKDVIEIIADYEIQHPRVPYVTSWYGLTDSDNQVIYTIKNSDFVTRRMVIIHELMHVDRRARGMQLLNHDEEETAIRLAAENAYRELFGAPQ